MSRLFEVIPRMRLDASQAMTIALRGCDGLTGCAAPRSAPKCPIPVRVPGSSDSIPHAGPAAGTSAAATRLIRCNRRPSVTIGITQLALEHKQSFLKDEQRHIALRNLLASFAPQPVQR